jgi:hypothetical protein
MERENCYDDLVVAVLGNKYEYGRALLAVEEFRGSGASLVLSARGGTLPNRVRRFFAPWYDADQGTVEAIAVTSLLVECGLVAIIWSNAWVDNENNAGSFVAKGAIGTTRAADRAACDVNSRILGRRGTLVVLPQTFSNDLIREYSKCSRHGCSPRRERTTSLSLLDRH